MLVHNCKSSIAISNRNLAVRKNSISSKWENNQIGTNKYKVVTPIDTMMIVSDPALELKEGDILFVPKNSKESLFP